MHCALTILQGEMLIEGDTMGVGRYAVQFDSYVASEDIHGRQWKGRQHTVQLRCCRGRHQWGEITPFNDDIAGGYVTRGGNAPCNGDVVGGDHWPCNGNVNEGRGHSL